MTKEQLVEALKMLGRGRIDAAEALAEYMMPTPKTFAVDVPSAPKKAK